MFLDLVFRRYRWYRKLRGGLWRKSRINGRWLHANYDLSILKDADEDWETGIVYEQKACPCLHTTPCQPNCSCVKPMMSHGCKRCASYGSEEQQRLKAEKLAKKIDTQFPPSTAEKLEEIAKLIKDNDLE